MKKLKRIGWLLLGGMCLLLCLAGCGGEGAKVEVPGEQQTWGNLSVFVPEGMTLVGGAIGDSEDKDCLQIVNPDDLFAYFIISIMEPDQAEMNIAITKELNDGKDIPEWKTGELTWHGVFHEYDGIPCYQIMTTSGETTFTVMSAGYEAESDISNAILSAVKRAE